MYSCRKTLLALDDYPAPNTNLFLSINIGGGHSEFA